MKFSQCYITKNEVWIYIQVVSLRIDYLIYSFFKSPPSYYGTATHCYIEYESQLMRRCVSQCQPLTRIPLRCDRKLATSFKTY